MHWPDDFLDYEKGPFKELLKGLVQVKIDEDYKKYMASDTYTYCNLMSEALARMCSGTAYVMTPDPNNIPQDGIKAQTEFPILQRDF